MTETLWTPRPDAIETTQMGRFIDYVQASSAPWVSDYPSLYRWSVESAQEFWPAVWDFTGVMAKRRWQAVYEPGQNFWDGRWFRGAELNFAENLLRYADVTPQKDALIFWNESGFQRRLSFAQLRAAVAEVAAGLAACGVEPGDRVAAFTPNLPEAVVAALATASLGAVWSSCSPDFGVHGVLDRFSQIAPKVLFTADGYWFKGKAIDSLATVAEVVKAIPSIQTVVVIPYLGRGPGERPANWVEFDTFRMSGTGAPPVYIAVPFDHPLYILYSSGTTGVPKCITHGTGGTLLQHRKEHALHTDIGADDRLFYFTTCGWMMWNWLVSGLAGGATLLLYDGSPFHPRPDILLEFADAEGMTVFGTSAKYLAALEKAGVVPRQLFRLERLRAILSTGSPLAPESFEFVYRDWKRTLLLSSISGGTDIVSCFALGNPLLPVYRGELQCRGLGMQVEIWNENGRSVVGVRGELVCTRPFPSMPIYFWNDSDNTKYRAAYFEKFPGVWAHGDFAELTEHGGLIIYGRSDAVLNPGGVRIGTAEIYRQVEKLPEILESIAIGQEWENDVRIILFVKLRDSLVLDDGLRTKIVQTIRANTTPRHVPAKILQVTDIPRTISGKIVELAVTNVVHNRPVKNTDALANPEALDYFRNRSELKS